MPHRRLGEILVQARLIDEARLRVALEEQSRWGGKLGLILVKMNAINEATLVEALSHQLSCPSVQLDGVQIPREALALVPFQLCDQHGLIPFGLQAKFLDVAMVDPLDSNVVDQLRMLTRLNIRPHLGGPQAIERAIQFHYRGRRSAPPGDDLDGRRVLMMGSDAIDLAPQPAAQPRPAAQAPPGRVNPRPPLRPSIGAEQTRPEPAAGELAAALSRIAELERLAGELVRENQALSARVQHLQALVGRDEDVLRKLMTLLVERGVCTREELLARISKAPPA